MNYHKKLAGFSLLELLLAVAILTSISAMIMVILFQTRRSEEVTDRLLKERRESRLIERLIKRDLSGVVALKEYLEVGKASGILGVDRSEVDVSVDQIYFHTHRPALAKYNVDELVDPQIHQVGYVLIRNPEQNELYSLYRLEKFYLGDNFELIENIFDFQQLNRPELKAALVHDRVLSMEITYLHEDQQTGQIASVPSWNSLDQTTAQQLPLALVIKIKLRKPDSEEVIDLELKTILRPKIGGVLWEV